MLIERGVLHGEADGIWGPDTREAITVYQRQQGIAVTGSIDMRTVSLAWRLRPAEPAGKPEHPVAVFVDWRSDFDRYSDLDWHPDLNGPGSTGQGQTGTGTAQSQTGQPSNQQNATGQTPNQNSGQAQNQPSSTTGQSSPSQSNTTGQAPSQSGSSSTANQPSANQSTSPIRRRAPVRARNSRLERAQSEGSRSLAGLLFARGLRLEGPVHAGFRDVSDFRSPSQSRENARSPVSVRRKECI